MARIWNAMLEASGNENYSGYIGDEMESAHVDVMTLWRKRSNLYRRLLIVLGTVGSYGLPLFDGVLLCRFDVDIVG